MQQSVSIRAKKWMGKNMLSKKGFIFLPLHLSAQTRSLSAPVIYRTTMTLELRFKVRLFRLPPSWILNLRMAKITRLPPTDFDFTKRPIGNSGAFFVSQF
jgi:hypothetical protein